MSLKFRPYQSAAIRSVFSYWENYDGNPIVVLPTGTGKSFVIAGFIQEAISLYPETRILVATHVRELILQNYLELLNLWPMAPAGIYSAGLGKRDSVSQILFCGLQTVYSKAFEIQKCDILIIDECQTLSPKNETMWGKFIADLKIINPHLKVLGLTATAYRMGSGLLTEEHNGVKPLFTDIAYEYSILEAIKEGYLCEVISKNMATVLDVSNVGKRGGEFIPGQLERAINIDSVTKAAIDEVMAYGKDRKTWLLFCAGVAHSHAVAAELNSRGIECAVITGDTPDFERDEILRRFKAGELRAVANNSVMTTGTNVPRIDMIVGLRPTGSPGLFLQMLGRGMRIFAGKFNCLYLDFGKNLSTHGPIDKIKPKKAGSGDGTAPVRVCEKCHCVCFAGCRVCPDCGEKFDEPELKISRTASSAPILSTQAHIEWRDVEEVYYAAHRKADKPTSMKVTYMTFGLRVDEWVCFSHGGFAQTKAANWHKQRSDLPVPKTIEEALAISYPAPRKIQIKQDGKFWRILAYDYTVDNDYTAEKPALEKEPEIEEVFW